MIGRFLFLQIFKSASLKPEVITLFIFIPTYGSSSTLFGKLGKIVLRIFLKSEGAVHTADKMILG